MANLERLEHEGVTVLKLNGCLNEQELADVEQSFHDATHRRGAAVVVDLSNVNFLTTPAISMFLEAARSLKCTGGRIAVSGPQPRIGDILRRLHLERLLPVFRTVDEGVESMQKLAHPEP